MKIRSQIELLADAAGAQTGGSSMVGRKYRVIDSRYGDVISEHDDPDSARIASRARPYSKIISWQTPAVTPVVKDLARRRMVKTNPDVD